MKMFKIFAALFMTASILLMTSCNGGTAPEETTGEESTAAEETTGAEETTDKVETTEKEEETTKPQDTTEKEEETTKPVDTSKPEIEENFENCLFIGDSRTVGFLRYADTGKADVFASTGMSVFRITREEIDGKTLDSYLDGGKYEKIYLMLGINEIGYNLDSVIKKYGELVDYIVEHQPDAALYIMANLHITEQRSSKDEYYNNERLNYINDGIKEFTDGNGIKYLDINPVFDDENNAFSLEYAYDDFHPHGIYYTTWLEWIAENS